METIESCFSEIIMINQGESHSGSAFPSEGCPLILGYFLICRGRRSHGIFKSADAGPKNSTSR